MEKKIYAIYVNVFSLIHSFRSLHGETFTPSCDNLEFFSLKKINIVPCLSKIIICISPCRHLRKRMNLPLHFLMIQSCQVWLKLDQLFFNRCKTTAKMYDPLLYLEGSYADSGPWLEMMLFKRNRFKTEVLKETGLSQPFLD